MGVCEYRLIVNGYYVINITALIEKNICIIMPYYRHFHNYVIFKMINKKKFEFEFCVTL